MASSKELKRLTLAGGAVFIAGVLVGNHTGGEAFADHAHDEVGKYVAGQPFDKESFVLDTLKHPVAKPTLDTAIRGALRQYGEEDAYYPSPEARAVVLCAGAAANSLALGDGVKNSFVIGGRLEDQKDQEGAANAYTIAADGCQAALDGALNDANPADIVIPVGEA